MNKPSPVVRALQQQRLNNDNQLANNVISTLGYQPDPGTAWEPFVQWCQKVGVNYCPARPTIVAAYVLHLHQFGRSFDEVMEHLSGIADLHNVMVRNPVTCGIVNAALASISEPGMVTPPVSWPKEEKAMFWHLPDVIRAIVKRREKEREKHVHRVANELGKLRKKVREYEVQKAKDGSAKDASDAKPNGGAEPAKADDKIPDEQRDSLEHQLWSPTARSSRKSKQRDGAGASQ